MTKTKKSFATCFDKDCEEFAELLMTLVSQYFLICNIRLSKEQFNKDRQITSNEYVLTIGEKGSKVNRASFPDTYDKYGIHIGYRGRKAWISCEHFDWNKTKLKDFHKDLIALLSEAKMRYDNIDSVIEKEVEKGRETTTMTVPKTDSIDKINFELIIDRYFKSIALENMPNQNPIRKFIQWFQNFWNSSDRRKEQYKFAVVLFYSKYIEDFLEINKNEISQEEDKMNF